MNDDLTEARAALQKFFGFADFRPGQAEVLRDPVAAPWPHGRRQTHRDGAPGDDAARRGESESRD